MTSFKLWPEALIILSACSSLVLAFFSAAVGVSQTELLAKLELVLPVRKAADLLLVLPFTGLIGSNISSGFSNQGNRFLGTSIRMRPDKYLPVKESGCRTISSYLPCATTLPPCTPAPGPISTT